MNVKLEDRPIEQVREETIDKLIVNYSHGVISAEAFERRLDLAMESDEHKVIIQQVADLEMEADAKYESTRRHQFAPNYSKAETEAPLKLYSILGTAERSGQWVVPKKIEVLNVLGTTNLDFSDAIFQHQNIELVTNDVLGSINIFVPEDVNVTCSAFGILSSVENKAPSIAHRQAPTITITGRTILGSLEISVKRTIKEKFLAFAEQLKATFQSK